jgi:integrase
VLPKVEKHVADYYTHDELLKLIDCVQDAKIETPVFLAAWFGLRRGEVVGLKWSSIDFTARTLTINGVIRDKKDGKQRNSQLYYVPEAKTRSSIRSFPMTDGAYNYLKKLKADQDERKEKPGYNHEWDEFVCVNEKGNIIAPYYISQTFPKLCVKCGLRRLRFHELRHTNISMLLESGANFVELASWAGHSDTKTTMSIYSHIQVDHSKKRLASMIENALN